MSSASIMEWNAKPTLQWDWENLIMFNATPNENPKKLRATDWELNGDKGIDSGSFNSSGVRSSSGSASGSAGGSNSDLGFACFSKSSKSASNNSSSVAEVKTSMHNFEASVAIPEDFNSKNELVKVKRTGTSPTLEASVGSGEGEPLLSLKLGKQTYFEDVCAGSDPKASRFSVTSMSSATPAKRTRSRSQGTQAPRCQVEGCNLDLSSAKDYHRKHRVCENHSKCPKVVVAGVERRFCQQCSRFHGLSEFDEKKRSCRRRLSDHNARRRKPQPGSVNLNPGRLCSSLYSTDGRQHMSFIWNKAPLVNAVCNGILPSETPSSSKFTITKEYMLKPDKIGGIDGQLHLPGSKLTNSIAMECCGSSGLLLSKPQSTTAGALNQGLEESMVTSSVDATPDLDRALSLLSTNSWGSCDPKPAALEQPMHSNQTTMPPPTLHGMPQGFQIGSSEYWRTEQQHSAHLRVHSLASNSGGNNYFQEFQPSRAPYDGDFYSSHLN